MLINIFSFLFLLYIHCFPCHLDGMARSYVLVQIIENHEIRPKTGRFSCFSDYNITNFFLTDKIFLQNSPKKLLTTRRAQGGVRAWR